MSKAIKVNTDDPTVKARKSLDGFWERADVKGRCWGPKRKDNSYSGTNITFALGDELVSVSMNGEGKLLVHAFKKAEKHQLSEEVKRILRQADLLIQD